MKRSLKLVYVVFILSFDVDGVGVLEGCIDKEGVF